MQAGQVQKIFRLYKLFIFLLVSTCAISCSKKNGAAITPAPIPPPVPSTVSTFKVKDAQILDSAGNVFVAKGVNVNGPLWPWTRPTTPDASLIADVWKCNIVRVNCWIQNPPYPNTNNADLDAIIKTFTDKKVVVLVEDHSFTGRYPNSAELSAAVTWWKAIANKHKNNSYVWFNLMNEPGEGGIPVPASWLNVHETLIKAIRDAGSENVIVCDEHGYGQANGFDAPSSSATLTYGQTLATKYKNIVFSLHTYDRWIYGKQRMENFIAATKAKKLALIFGEYGVGNNYSSEVASNMFKACIPNKIGRIAWQWVGEDNHKLVTNGAGGGFDIDIKTGAKPGNLSFVGNMIWLDNHDMLQANDAALTPPALITYNTTFEIGNPVSGQSDINGWINFGTSEIDATPSNVHEGTFSVKIKSGSGGGLGQFIYLQPSTSYKISAWGKHSQPAVSTTTLGLKYTTTAGGAEEYIASLDFTEDVFTEKSATFTTPAQIASMFLFIYKNDSTPAFWCDDIRIEKL